MKDKNKFYSPMQKGMLFIMISAILLCFVFGMLYHSKNQSWMLSCAITFGVIAYHFVIRFLSPVLIIAVTHKNYNHESKWFRQKRREPDFYDRIKVKKWKGKVAAFTYDPGEFSAKLHTYREIVNNMCHAEAVHELIIVLSFTSLFFSIPFGSFPVFLITAILAALIDLQFVILQRYNRPRMIKLIQKEG